MDTLLNRNYRSVAILTTPKSAECPTAGRYYGGRRRGNALDGARRRIHRFPNERAKREPTSRGSFKEVKPVQVRPHHLFVSYGQRWRKLISVVRFPVVASKPIQASRGRNNAQEKISGRNLAAGFFSSHFLFGRIPRVGSSAKWLGSALLKALSNYLTTALRTASTPLWLRLRRIVGIRAPLDWQVPLRHRITGN